MCIEVWVLQECGEIMTDQVRAYQLLKARGVVVMMINWKMMDNRSLLQNTLSCNSNVQTHPTIDIYIYFKKKGPVNLAKGTNHFLRRADVEALIRQGMLEHVTPQSARCEGGGGGAGGV